MWADNTEMPEMQGSWGPNAGLHEMTVSTCSAEEVRAQGSVGQLLLKEAVWQVSRCTTAETKGGLGFLFYLIHI